MLKRWCPLLDAHVTLFRWGHLLSNLHCVLFYFHASHFHIHTRIQTLDRPPTRQPGDDVHHDSRSWGDADHDDHSGHDQYRLGGGDRAPFESKSVSPVFGKSWK